MNALLLVRSKFMVSREFGTGDIPREPLVTIAGVTKPAESDEMTKDWWLVTFREPWAKPLKVNTTHRDALMLMFGQETDGWLGKRIGLYAMQGTFFGKRQTAVRIAGSPDIKQACSFQVKKFSGGRDTYNLKPLVVPGDAGPLNAKSEWITFGVGSQAPKKITELSDADLAASIELADKNIAGVPAGTTPPWLNRTKAQLEALRAESAMRAEVRTPEAPPAPVDEDAPF